jgi:hypothetical protein
MWCCGRSGGWGCPVSWTSTMCLWRNPKHFSSSRLTSCYGTIRSTRKSFSSAIHLVATSLCCTSWSTSHLPATLSKWSCFRRRESHRRRKITSQRWTVFRIVCTSWEINSRGVFRLLTSRRSGVFALALSKGCWGMLWRIVGLRLGNKF